MYVRRHFTLFRAIAWTWSVLPVLAAWAGALTAAHVLLDLEWLRIPPLPVGVLGTAVAFYLGFKGSSAYDRLWEARKIWGGIVNTSRTWGMFVTGFVTDRHVQAPLPTPVTDVHRELILRHVAWLGALRTLLRRRKSWEHTLPFNDRWRGIFGTIDMGADTLRARMADFVSEEELTRVMAAPNAATRLLHLQSDRLRALLDDGRIEDFRHMELARLLETMFTLQGQAERIKNFPLPRQYASANHWFVKIFLALLPLALLDAFHVDDLPEVFVWAVVPLSMVVGWVFWVWDQVVDYTENPFEGLVNDIPMDALSRTIERDLRAMLGETELPDPVAPIHDETLM